MTRRHQETWLQQRHDLIVRNVVRDFVRANSFFLNLAPGGSNESPPYEQLERWVGSQSKRGLLWLLKDNSHRLWRNVDPGGYPEAFFFDWTVGAIFHEAMKLKENVYMVERYQPAYQKAAGVAGNDERVARCRVFFEQTLEDIRKGMERLGGFFQQAAEYLGPLLLRERKNVLLIRYLLEAGEEIARLWDEDGGPSRVLETLFPDGVDKAFCDAGLSYLAGSWYSEARAAFEQALEMNPDCSEAESGLKLLEKCVEEAAFVTRKNGLRTELQ